VYRPIRHDAPQRRYRYVASANWCLFGQTCLTFTLHSAGLYIITRWRRRHLLFPLILSQHCLSTAIITREHARTRDYIMHDVRRCSAVLASKLTVVKLSLPRGRWKCRTTQKSGERFKLDTGSRHERQQEARLMLTNPRDAFTGQSRWPNMVPFDMLSMLSY